MSRRTPHDRQLLQPRQDHEERDEPRMKARQVRRRLHTTSRPFQGRLLDMAEARREIVAALRNHRAAAAVRRSGDQHEQQQKQLSQPQQQQEQMQTQWRPPAVSCDAFFSGHLCDSPLADFIAAGAGCSSSSTLRYLTPVAVEPPAAIGGGVDHLSCSLPAQPLGLSLSFRGFADSSVHDDVKNSHDSWDRRLIQPLPASSFSVCSSPLAAAMLSHDGSPTFGTAADNAPSSATALRPVLEGDQEGAAAVYPIGERRSDDAVDVATPAWWGDLLGDQSTEGVGGGEVGAPAGQEGGGAVVVAGTPAAGWLWDGSGQQGITGSGKPDGVPEMHLDGDDDYHHGDDAGDGEDITLPCMEIEGWDDGEWFSS